jgi:hypothetical protein
VPGGDHPADQSVLFFHEGCVRRIGLDLHAGFQRRVSVQCLGQQIGTQPRKPVHKYDSRLDIADSGVPLQEDPPGVETCVHLHRRHARRLLTIHDRPVHRSRTPIFWKQRKVNIDRTHRERCQKRLGKDPAIGDDDRDIRGMRAKLLRRGGRSEFLRLKDRNTVLGRPLLHRRFSDRITSARRAVGLGVHRNDLVTVIDETL